MTDISRRRACADARARFLKDLRKTGLVRAAADIAGVRRSSLYKWRATLPEFAAAWCAVPGLRRPPHIPTGPATVPDGSKSRTGSAAYLDPRPPDG
jgi:transposase-like protein